MDSKLQTEAYVGFFGSESGEQFLKVVNGMLGDCHRAAEDNADSARDKMQEARGIRSVLDHITVITAKGNAYKS